MGRARSGFATWALIIALGGAAAAQPAGPPEQRPAQPDTDEQRKADLVVASRILVQEGVLDSFGHVTVRSLQNPNRYFMPRAMPPGLVTEKDIVELDLNSAPVDPNAPRTNGERFIHGEIYRLRADVQAVVHSHSPAVVPFGIVKGVPFRPVYHMAAFIGEAAPIFEIRDAGGDDTDLLISNSKLGAALAKTLGQGNVVLMRGHGATIVGTDLREAIFRAVYTEGNARLQAEALRIGPVTYLSSGEIKTATVNVGGQKNRAWDLWRMQAEGKLP